jgi:hypothetical protein
MSRRAKDQRREMKEEISMFKARKTAARESKSGKPASSGKK